MLASCIKIYVSLNAGRRFNLAAFEMLLNGMRTNEERMRTLDEVRQGVKEADVFHLKIDDRDS